MTKIEKKQILENFKDNLIQSTPTGLIPIWILLEEYYKLLKILNLKD